MKQAEIQELTEFLMDYTISMLAVGTYTSRVVKCVTRISESFGYDVHLMIFSRNITISVLKPDDYSIRRTYVRKHKDGIINFNIISLLSALSWHAYDERITLSQLKRLYNNIMHKQNNGFIVTLILLCFANAAFCRIFGGDVASMIIVFVANFIGINTRRILLMLHIDLRAIFLICAFLSSMIAYFGTRLGITNTPDVAIGTSVLFLIPGVYLINSVIDVLDGHSLIGLSRAISTLILISCIAIGLYMTLSFANIRIGY